MIDRWLRLELACAWLPTCVACIESKQAHERLQGASTSMTRFLTATVTAGWFRQPTAVVLHVTLSCHAGTASPQLLRSLHQNRLEWSSAQLWAFHMPCPVPKLVQVTACSTCLPDTTQVHPAADLSTEDLVGS
jgi:hypothetical protein